MAIWFRDITGPLNILSKGKLTAYLGCLCLSLVVLTLLVQNGSFSQDSTFSQESTSLKKTPDDMLQDAAVFSREKDMDGVPVSSKTKVIIFGYMRSGSSLLGEIIQSHPEMFYVYEPLWYLWDYYVPTKMNVTTNLWQRTKPMWRTTKADVVSPLDFMTYMFNCNLTARNLNFLSWSIFSPDFRNSRCPYMKNGRSLVRTSRSCVSRLSKSCSASSAVLLKVVRMSTMDAKEYLDKHDDVKIIHLVRDPRGSLLSRMKLGKNSSTSEMHNNYTNNCRRIYNDILMSQSLPSKYKGKILTIRYEDMTQNLEAYTRKLFGFINMDMHPQVLKHLRVINGTDKNSAVSDKTRADPYRTAYRWRAKIPFSLVQKVDRACIDLYKTMGYKPFNSKQDLRNDMVPARSRVYGKGLLKVEL